MGHGAPTNVDDIPLYLKNIRGGTDSSPEVIQIIRDRYEAIGGSSPLLEITKGQADELEKFINQNGGNFRNNLDLYKEARSCMNVLLPFYSLYEQLLWRQIRFGARPHHIGLIVDGNRRFAKLQGFVNTNEGHSAGSDRLEDFLNWCWRLDIKIVTLFAFSTENFSRSPEEVDYLMKLILRKLRDFQEDPVIIEEQVKIKVIGRREDLSTEMITEINNIESMTCEHENFQLNIAISYGGRA